MVRNFILKFLGITYYFRKGGGRILEIRKKKFFLPFIEA